MKGDFGILDEPVQGTFKDKFEGANYGKEINAQHTNPGFVLDEKYADGAVSENDASTLELRKISKTEEETDKEYDPYEHREVDHPTTNWETLLHLLKGCLGTGILAMPKAFSNSGYVIGTFGTILIGLMCIYCMQLLIRSEYELCKRKRVGSLTYPAMTQLAFLQGPQPLRKLAPYTVHIVNTFLLIYQLGICCVYIVFISANVQTVVNIYIKKDLGIEIYMLIFLLPLIFLNWVGNLKRLAPLSTIANVITLISFGIIIYFIALNPPNLEGKDMVGKIENFPLFLGTVLFSLEAIGVIMPLENEMKTPKAYVGICGVLNIGMSVVTLLYMGMGLLGYLSYGNTVEGSITLSLPADDYLAQAVKVSLAVAIFISYGLQFYVAVDITWSEYLGPKLEKNSRRVLWEYVTRTCLVLITFLLAVAVPALDLFISLFGAFCLSALGIAVPATIETLTYWYSIKGWRFYVMLIKNLVIIVFGICGFIAGTYSSLRDIIKEFS